MIVYDWYILYTMPNLERRIRSELLKRGMEVFLPLCKTIRQWSDRKKTIEIPLFPNYVFVKFDIKDRFKVLSIPGTLRFLATGDKFETISQQEIDLIHHSLQFNPATSASHFAAGEVVRVIAGPLIGTQGTLYTIRGQQRLALCIEAINQVITVDISTDEVERVTDRLLTAS